MRVQEEVRNTRIQTKQLRRDVRDQEVRNREQKAENHKALSQAQSALKSNEAIQEILTLDKKQIEKLMAMMEGRTIPKKESRPKVDSAAGALNREALHWAVGTRKPDSPHTRELKRRLPELEQAFVELGHLVGESDPWAIGHAVLERVSEQALGVWQALMGVCGRNGRSCGGEAGGGEAEGLCGAASWPDLLELACDLSVSGWSRGPAVPDVVTARPPAVLSRSTASIASH